MHVGGAYTTNLLRRALHRAGWHKLALPIALITLRTSSTQPTARRRGVYGACTREGGAQRFAHSWGSAGLKADDTRQTLAYQAIVRDDSS